MRATSVIRARTRILQGDIVRTTSVIRGWVETSRIPSGIRGWVETVRPPSVDFHGYQATGYVDDVHAHRSLHDMQRRHRPDRALLERRTQPMRMPG